MWLVLEVKAVREDCPYLGGVRELRKLRPVCWIVCPAPPLEPE